MPPPKEWIPGRNPWMSIIRLALVGRVVECNWSYRENLKQCRLVVWASFAGGAEDAGGS